MRKVIVTMFLSLDGVTQAPGGEDEDREGGFEHGGWVVPYGDDEFGTFKLAETMASDTLLLDRKTYDAAESWPNVTDDAGFADKMNSMPKFVVSTTLASGSWHRSRYSGRSSHRTQAAARPEHLDRWQHHAGSDIDAARSG